MGLKGWLRQRISLVAGQAREYAPRIRTTNALYIVNNTSATIHVGAARDVDTNPENRIQPNSNGPVPLSAPGESMYLYSASNVDLIVIEITTDDLTMVFAMQVVVSDITSALDVSDRAARALGRVGIQVAGADVAVGNPVHVDVTDEANRALGKVGVQVAGADVATGNPVPTNEVGSATATSAADVANTQVQIVLALVAGQAHRIKSAHFGWSGAAPANPVQATIGDGATTLRFGVGSQGLSHVFGTGWAAAVGAAVTITLPAGGAGVIGNITVEYETF